MTKVDIEKNILQETQGLSLDMLREILDFIQFLKTKQTRETKKVDVLVLKTKQTRETKKVDVLAVLPKHQLGKIRSSLRREDIYADAR